MTTAFHACVLAQRLTLVAGHASAERLVLRMAKAVPNFLPSPGVACPLADVELPSANGHDAPA